MSRYAYNIAQTGDALDLLRSLPDACTPLVHFDPQYRGTLDRQRYGNEGARQSARCALPQMPEEYIDACIREAARVLVPSGYMLLWADTFNLLEGHHLRLADVFKCVDLISWDSERFGMGYRTRRCGGYLIVLQRPPVRAKATWHDHRIRDRWREKIDRAAYPHPHAKPIGLISRLIDATTQRGALVVDPAAGGFTALNAARNLERRFIGCDCKFDSVIAAKQQAEA
jgi:site-specific DNA-methyltransferase (adenine-specific)